MNDELKAREADTWKAAIEQGNLAGLDEILAPNMVVHSTPAADIVGRDAYKQWLAGFLALGSGHEFTTSDWVGDGETLAVRWEWRYRSSGAEPHRKAPATDNPVTVKGMSMVRTVDGREVERWDYIDRLGYRQQLGAIPAPGAGG